MVFTHNNSTFLVLLLLLVLFAASIATPLDDYMLKEDSNYRFKCQLYLHDFYHLEQQFHAPYMLCF
jgi:hypothetical protein